MTTRAAIYVRVSTAGQEEEGTSLDSQERLCREYAAGQGWEVVRVFQDVHTGSQWRERPGLQELRDLVRVRAVDVVLCYALDRLSRNQTHVAVITEEIEHYGARLELVTEDFENSTVGRFIRSARAFAAELEREKIVERQVRGKRERALQGKLSASAAALYGYVPATGPDGKEVVREIVESQAEVVREIYRRASEGQSTRAIAAWLNASGIPSPAAARGRLDAVWAKSQVLRVLTNPAYKGMPAAWRYRSRGKHQNPENRPEEEWIFLAPHVSPAIVSPELWDAVQERLKSNSGATTRNQTRQYLLRGLIYCSVCGSRMYSEIERGRRTYRCGSRQRKGGKCEGKRVRADDVEADVWNQAVQLLTNPMAISREIERQRELAGKPREVGRQRVLQRTLERLDKRKAALTRRFQQTEDDTVWDLIMSDLKRIEEEREATLAALEDARTEEARRQESLRLRADLRTFMERAAANVDRFDFDQKRFTLEQALRVTVWASGKEWSVEWAL